MPFSSSLDRRRFLVGSSAWAGLAVSANLASAADQPAPGTPVEIEVSPVEALMRQHGILRRCLLIYDETSQRLDSNRDFDMTVLGRAAEIVRNFIEDYHQKLEEDFLFPRFRKAGRLLDLVELLQTQHRRGRGITEKIRQLAVAATLKKESDRRQLSDHIGSFVRMQRPHEAREDTILFPMFRKLLRGKDYDDLGEQFETLADQKFGENSYDQAVSDVSRLEQQLGIYDLAQFTPK